MDMTRSASSSKSISSFLKPSVAQTVVEAESHWVLIVSKHNLTFLTSDHATLKFLATDALALYFTRSFLLIDESNDKSLMLEVGVAQDIWYICCKYWYY